VLRDLAAIVGQLALLVGDSALALHVGDAIALARLVLAQFLLLVEQGGAVRFVIATRVGLATLGVARLLLAPCGLPAGDRRLACLVVASCVLGSATLRIAGGLLALDVLAALRILASRHVGPTLGVLFRLFALHGVAAGIRLAVDDLGPLARLGLLADGLAPGGGLPLRGDRTVMRLAGLVGLFRLWRIGVLVAMPRTVAVVLRERRARQGQRKRQGADAERDVRVLRRVHGDLACDRNVAVTRWREAA
jgi:hypothetical protein